jgi:CheY-like chemotaxis protein
MSNEERARVVLLVEDHDDTRELLRRFLAQRGLSVIEAKDGQEGIDLARRHRPDLIVMDLNMPVVNGLTAARELRSDDSFKLMPLIIITAYGALGIEMFNDIDALGQGRIEYLPKPFAPEHLYELVRQLLPAA